MLETFLLVYDNKASFLYVVLLHVFKYDSANLNPVHVCACVCMCVCVCVCVCGAFVRCEFEFALDAA
jgi:hypothetical protein